MKKTEKRALTESDLAGEISRLTDQYYSDLEKIFVDYDNNLVKCSDVPVEKWFYIVSSMPYKKDADNDFFQFLTGTQKKEMFARPAILMKNAENGLDCKKKTILICSNARCNNIVYRLVGVSNRPDRKIHHVYPQLMINLSWVDFDATYPGMRINGVNYGYKQLL